MKLYKGMGKIIVFHPINLNTLYLLNLLYSNNEIIIVRGRLANYSLNGFKAKFLELAVPCLH